MEVKLQIIQEEGTEIRISEPDLDNEIVLEISESGQEEYTTVWLDIAQATKIYDWLYTQIKTMEKNEKNQIVKNG